MLHKWHKVTPSESVVVVSWFFLGVEVQYVHSWSETVAPGHRTEEIQNDNIIIPFFPSALPATLMCFLLCGRRAKECHQNDLHLSRWSEVEP